MPQVQTILVGSTVAIVTPNTPVGRVIVTMVAGTAAEVYITFDGTDPVVPTNAVLVVGNQQVLPAVLGASVVIDPALAGDHFVSSQIRLLSAGTPTVLVQW